ERASAADIEFELTDADAQAACEICRRLDGLPLALELAASQVAVFGVQGLARRLNDSFAVLTNGRRTVLGRQQALRATIDWSYGLLSDVGKIVLRRLAVFRGDFTMQAARAVAGYAGSTSEDVVQGVANLMDKSLLAADIGGDTTYYRLLETTRIYASRILQ